MTRHDDVDARREKRANPDIIVPTTYRNLSCLEDRSNRPGKRTSIEGPRFGDKNASEERSARADATGTRAILFSAFKRRR